MFQIRGTPTYMGLQYTKDVYTPMSTFSTQWLRVTLALAATYGRHHPPSQTDTDVAPRHPLTRGRDLSLHATTEVHKHLQRIHSTRACSMRREISYIADVNKDERETCMH